MRCSLNSLLTMLGNNETLNSGTEGLFEFIQETSYTAHHYEQVDVELITALCTGGYTQPVLCKPAQLLLQLSPSAFSAFVHAWMSELPIEKEMLAFGRKVIAAGENAKSKIEVKQQAAERAASDHGDENMRIVQAAAYKVQREFHLMKGILRFTAPSRTQTDEDSFGNTKIFIARCSPDHFVLPALGEHFTARFGETAWAIIDEKRRLYLYRRPEEQAKIEFLTGDNAFCNNGNNDDWENLWQHYHKTINNEDRKNPGLQRQFMPQRYWKYLPEIPKM